MTDLTPEEKWRRLQNPQSAADYGLFLTKDELETFDEGRQFIAGFKAQQEWCADIERRMEQLGENAGRSMNELQERIFGLVPERK